VHDLQLDSVGVIEEHCVIPRRVPVFLGLALDLGSLVPQPLGTVVDRGAGGSLEREVVKADAIAVVRQLRFGLRLAEADLAARA